MEKMQVQIIAADNVFALHNEVNKALQRPAHEVVSIQFTAITITPDMILTSKITQPYAVMITFRVFDPPLKKVE
jgi:hypothetical protein